MKTNADLVTESSSCNLVPSIRAALIARVERLLSRPVIAEVVSPTNAQPDSPPQTAPQSLVSVLQRSANRFRPTQGLSSSRSTWEEDADGSCTVRICLDYDGVWRGYEKEVRETVANTVESPVAFLTAEQKLLLERSPREFLALPHRPETSELVSFDTEFVGGCERVVSLTIAMPPVSPTAIRYIAIIPNLVQLERQLDALTVLETAAADGALATLRQLVGLPATSISDDMPPDLNVVVPETKDLDVFQRECIAKAMATPHFAVIHGPPGSGKTSVISSVLQRAAARGDRVLVVSPTHVAVDNVVEKLTTSSSNGHPATLNPCKLPVRYAARESRLLEHARKYWVGSKTQRRAATVSRRVQESLIKAMPLAESLYAMEDPNASGNAPLSQAVAANEQIICGTPIGILSHRPVQEATPGSFDLLIIDEVSKMTLPEFLAIAVKARRWLLVGDPKQLPPFINPEEQSCTLDDVIDPLLELVCSVGAVLERVRPALRTEQRLVVVTSSPVKLISAIRAHLREVSIDHLPPISAIDEGKTTGIITCVPTRLDDACAMLSEMGQRDRMINPSRDGAVRILVERGIRIAPPAIGSGRALVEPRARAQSLIFENGFAVYHAKPWSDRSRQKLRICGFRNGLAKYLPSASGIATLHALSEAEAQAARERYIRSISLRFGLGLVSIYDLLTDIPLESFDVSPLRELEQLSGCLLRQAVRPFVGTLTRQYRMHPSLSRVPRELFYFDEALHDGKVAADDDCRVSLVQSNGSTECESNPDEVERICEMLKDMEGSVTEETSIMIITPYRQQEACIRKAIDDLRDGGFISRSKPEVCTLDRCQGREADYVFISLVRSPASVFMDMPNRWNVALTRAKLQLVIVGDIDAYLCEAARARRDTKRCDDRVMMSLPARIIESYDRLIADYRAGWREPTTAPSPILV